MFKDRIKEARKAAGLSQEQLGRILGISKQTISDYERGYSEPDMAKVTSLMSALSIDANYLWQDEMKTTNAESDVSARAMEIAKAYDAMSDYSKAIIDCVIAQEEKRRADSFGKTKLMRSTIKEVPTVEEMFGIKTAHDSDLQARYNSRKEVEELEAEIAMEKEENL